MTESRRPDGGKAFDDPAPAPPPSEQPPANGWYPDPAIPGRERFWALGGWTNRTRVGLFEFVSPPGPMTSEEIAWMTYQEIRRVRGWVGWILWIALIVLAVNVIGGVIFLA